MTEKDKIIDIILIADVTERVADSIADTLIENGIGDIAEWKKRADKLEKLLFILVRNQIIDKGKKLGKTDDEICDMAIDTIQAMADMVSFEKIGILMGDRKIEIEEERK